MTSFGELLRQYRLAVGMTQEALAERAGLSVRTLAYLERDRRGAPRQDTLELLVRALTLSPDEQTSFLAAARQGDAGSPSPAPPHHPSGPALHPLVGRGNVLDQLDAHLLGRGPPLFSIAGEPGMGKTRLLREAAQRAVAQGWTVLTGGCHRLGGQDAYAPLLDALQRHVAGLDLLTLRRQLEGCAWLVRLLPELADGPIPPLPAYSPPADQQRRLMFTAVQRYLANAAGPCGTLLVLDDLQWAGWDALDLLATLLRSAAMIPVRVVAAYRDTEVHADHPLATLLADLAPAGLARQQQLGPLSEQDASRLLAALLVDAEEVRSGVEEQVLRRAGGVPFFLVSCSQMLRTAEAEMAADLVPWDLAQSIRQRVATLAKPAQDALGIAAVIGRAGRRSLLQEVTSLPEAELAAALDEICRSRLLIEQGRDGYEFSHDVVREVVEADLGRAHGAILHRRVAEALERLPQEVRDQRAADLAWHYEQGAALAPALSYALLAGDRAKQVYAYSEAEGHYRTALELARELGEATQQAGALRRLGGMLRIAERFDEAIEVLEEAARLYQTAGDFEREAHAVTEIGMAHFFRTTLDEGTARVQALLQANVLREPSAGLAALYAALTRLLWRAHRWPETLAAAERASTIARAVGDDRALALAEGFRGRALCDMGHWEEAEETLAGAIPLAEAAGDPEILYGALRYRTDLFFNAGDFERASMQFRRDIEIIERMGNPGWMAYSLAYLGWSDFHAGDWLQARANLERAVTINRCTDQSWFKALPLLALGELCMAEGRWEEASAYLEEGLAVAERSPDFQWEELARSLLAQLSVLQGRPSLALAQIQPVLDQGRTAQYAYFIPWYVALAWTHLEVGETGEAAAILAWLSKQVEAERSRFFRAGWVWMHGMVLTRQHRWEEARGAFEETVTLARSMPHPYLEARALYEWGRMLLDQEKVNQQEGECRHLPRRDSERPGREAHELLERAYLIFERLGAQPYVEWAQQLLPARQLHPSHDLPG